MLVNRIIPLSVMLLLTGCATLNESECRSADWYAIGWEDGSKGRLAAYVGQHRKACAEYGVKPDLEHYRRGHAQGVAQYCTPPKGFQAGNSGRVYNGVCPPLLSEDFLFAYEQGRELYLLREDMRRMGNERIAAEHELEEIVDQIGGLESQLISKSGTAIQRQAWLQELKKLQYDRGQLEGLIHGLELEEARTQGEYEALSAQYRY